MGTENLNQEMKKQLRIKLFLLIKLFHHVLAEECELKPVPPDNAKVSCTEFAGCRIKCESKYLFPAGENVVYYHCDPEDGVYKINSDNPEDYDQCIAQCKPPCGNGGNCIRPNTCECQPGWTGKRCKQEITLKPVLTSTPAYDANLGTTTQLSTEMLETTIHNNERSNFSSEVTYILNITTPINDEYFGKNTLLPTGYIQTTTNSNGHSGISSNITDEIDLTTQNNDTYIENSTITDILPTENSTITEILPTENSTITNSLPDVNSTITDILPNVNSTITDILNTTSPTNAGHIETSTESLQATFNSTKNNSQISTETLKNIIIDTTTQLSTELLRSTNNNSGNDNIDSSTTDILNVTESPNYYELDNFNGNVSLLSVTYSNEETTVTSAKYSVVSMPFLGTINSSSSEMPLENNSFSFEVETDQTVKPTGSSLIYTSDPKKSPTEETSIFLNWTNNGSIYNDIISISTDIFDETEEFNISDFKEYDNNSSTGRSSVYDYTDDHFSTQNTSKTFSTVLPHTENSTLELLPFNFTKNIYKFKNITAYIDIILGYGVQQRDCGPEPLWWWLVSLLLAITALLTLTNVMLNILTLKWRRNIAQLREMAANQPTKTMPITFFRSLELNDTPLAEDASV
ncbi:unnamed protein product [Meganyctiphanes norvegica]|uniref:EGF-like domain-containing protein n=1 Tax=Meganyctiphanes norvegica TaxID=48144 RepID=A0AAV2R5A9_MEGNR